MTIFVCITCFFPKQKLVFCLICFSCRICNVGYGLGDSQMFFFSCLINILWCTLQSPYQVITYKTSFGSVKYKKIFWQHFQSWEPARPLQRSPGPYGPEMPKKSQNVLAWLPLQTLAVKINFVFVQILGGEKLLKFVEKCRWNIFKRRPERG